jgi:hypothetical protein
MSYQFTPFKIYLIGFLILFLLFFVCWFPKAEVILIINPEPLIMDLETQLDVRAQKICFNPNILPAEITTESQEEFPEYYFMESLKEEGTNQILIFKKEDLKDLIFFQTEKLLNEKWSESPFKTGKRVFAFHPEQWEIQILKKDFILEKATIRVMLSEEVVPRYNEEQLKKEIQFKKISWAKEELKKFPEIKEVKINSFPGFWPQTPLFSQRINFSVQLLKN